MLTQELISVLNQVSDDLHRSCFSLKSEFKKGVDFSLKSGFTKILIKPVFPLPGYNIAAS